MRIFRSVASLAAVAVLGVAGACDKTAVQDIAAPASGARLRFFHFGVNAPGVHFYAGDIKATAVLTATGIESTTGTTYSGAANGGLYIALPPGQRPLTGRIAATVDKDLIVATVAQNLEDGKAYSFYLSGFYNTTAKTSEAFVVEDPIPANFDWNQAYVRFVHGISNAAPMTLFARNTVTGIESAVGAEVAYRSAGAFVALAPANYDLGTRLTGVTTNAISRTAVSFVAGRVYTVSSRGDFTVVSTTAVNRPFLDNTANR
jgi:hypothetical protein